MTGIKHVVTGVKQDIKGVQQDLKSEVQTASEAILTSVTAGQSQLLELIRKLGEKSDPVKNESASHVS
jgi:hypothetical protein